MGNFFKNIGRGLKLAFKTVTFHWKQYFCFFMAILAMETMFGIIVMSSSKNIDSYSEDVKKYKWHFAMTNLDAKQREYFEDRFPNDGLSAYTVESNSSADGAGVIYIRIDLEKTSHNSLERAFSDFQKFVYSMPSGGDRTSAKDVKFQFSPLYELNDKLLSMRLECAAKLLILALVSIAVIILLLNIRLNHFKFTYGIYMSYGADTKKLFSTSFWDMIVIGILTFLPAVIISAVMSFTLYSNGSFAAGQILEFLKSYVPLNLFGILFLIPVCIIAVFIPIKITASQPPLKLLVAQDNSNLVSSPRISKQLIGKKFPKAYESLGLFRFRRYVATVVASSVLFASIFVWISFYSTIYDFNTQQEQAEFTVNINCEMEKITGYVQDKKYDQTDEYRKTRDNVYKENYSLNLAAALESFYTAEYEISYYPDDTVKDVVDVITGNSVRSEYINARNAIVKDGLKSDLYGKFSPSSNFRKYENYITDGDYLNGDNNPEVQYCQVREKNGLVVAVYSKSTKKTYKYPDNLMSNMAKASSSLETLAKDEMFTLLKNIDFDLFTVEGGSDEEVLMNQNYVYIGFEKDNVKAFSGLEYNPSLEKKVTDKVQFYSLDSKGFNLDFLGKYTLDIMNGEDELNIVDMEHKDGNKYIIISETAANSQILKIKPGDTVEIGYTDEIKDEPDSNLSGEAYLAELINNGEFTTKETYTVYAVIKDMPTSEKIPVYVLESDYSDITGMKNISNTFSVYVAPNTTQKTIDSLYEKLVSTVGEYAEIKWNNAVAENRENIEMNNLPVIQTIAVFSLILSPLFWFFSQIMFYGKREEEFRMLRGLGATEGEIKKIFRKDARTFALLGILSTLLVGMLGVFVIYKLNMTYVAFFSTGALHLYRFNMPWIALAIATVFTGVCAYLASIIPYRIDRKKTKKALAREFGDE